MYGRVAGMHLDTRGSISPILRFEFETGKELAAANIRDAHYLGTGFCLAGSPSLHIFATARHVVDMPLKTNQRIGIGRLVGEGTFWWDYWEFHRSADLALRS
jgi:hypothetical protein